MNPNKDKMASPNELILFNFPESVFGRRIVRYLNLRGLPFSQVRVPPNMPRPILQEKLGVNYRRIPILSIGRDIYIDSRLILEKLETMFPDGTLGAKDAFGAGVEGMLENFIIDGGPFWRTSGCIPVTAPLVQNEVWMKDRFDGSGGAFTKESLQANRAWCISQLRLYYGIVEQMLSDGRDWIVGGDGPSLAEIHAGWVFDWGVHMGSDMRLRHNPNVDPNEDMTKALGEQEFPKLHAWVERFRQVSDQAAKANKHGGGMEEGAERESEVVKKILAAEYAQDAKIPFEEGDVLGLKKGQKISIAPTDFGFTHKDEGTLVGLSKSEVVLEVDVPNGQGKLRLHYPRINFKIQAV